MRLFVDASAIVAILRGEADAAELAARLLDADVRFTSAIAIFEATLAAARGGAVEKETAEAEVRAFIERTRVQVVTIGQEEARIALEAHARFGKGRHPAALNLGDCFAYACARAYSAALLFKGDDFSLTDIERA